MTKKQKWIIAAGVVTVGMLLFPPWDRPIDPARYGFVWDPPPNRGINWDFLGLQLAACWLVWFIWGTSDKSE